jgi:predicted ATPase
MLQQMGADVVLARAHAEAALAFTIEHKVPYYQAWSEILTSYAVAREHGDAGSLERLSQCISRLKESGARLRLPYYLWLLARLHGQIGSTDAGLAVIDEALAESRANNERWWDSELHRLRSELLLASGADEYDVEVALLRAAEIARAQQAKSLELRAATSLAKHWRDGNRADDARRLLTDIYSWFTEGFDTPDLQSARSLITVLL